MAAAVASTINTPSSSSSSSSSSASLLPKSAYIRLATAEDVPVVLALIRELAEFEQLSHQCVATEDQVLAAITAAPPFKGPTATLLEVAEVAGGDADVEGETHVALELAEPVADPNATSFTSSKDTRRIVVGLVLVYPTFSSFLAKAGLWVEDMYIRAPYRRLGFGRMLLGSIATHAARQDFGRVEWLVLDWNERAIKFYQSMGAEINPQWRVCRLADDSLKSYATK